MAPGAAETISLGEFAVRGKDKYAWWRDGRSVEDAFCLDQLLGDDVDVVIREWSPLWGRSGAFAEGLEALPSKQAKMIWNANVTGRKHLLRSARLVSPRELASHEIQMRQVWRHAAAAGADVCDPDMDGGDDASTLRTAFEKGGVFGDAYHKFSSTFYLRSARRSRRSGSGSASARSPIVGRGRAVAQDVATRP